MEDKFYDWYSANEDRLEETGIVFLLDSASSKALAINVDDIPIKFQVEKKGISSKIIF